MKTKWWLSSRITQNTISKKNITFFLPFTREIDAKKTRFQPAKTQKMTNFFVTLEFKILRLLIMNMWWLTTRTKKNTTSNHKNFTMLHLIFREIYVEKTHFLPAKTQKMTNFFMTLEFKFLGLFMNNKWWLSSRTTQNTTSKHKHFNIFPLILWEIDADKSSFQRDKAQKLTTYFMTLEFNILRSFMKNKWWITNRSTQNTTTNH
jgi:hypothetical protein